MPPDEEHENLDEANQIGDVPVPKWWLEKVLADAFASKSSTPEITAARRIDLNQGYLSFIGKLSIDWNPPNESLPKSLAIKVPTGTKIEAEVEKWKEQHKDDDMPGVEKKDMDSLVDTTHFNECTIYELLKAECDSVPKIIKMPLCYSSNAVHKAANPGFLLMQDFDGLAKTPSIIDGLTLGQCRVLVKYIGALQAYGLTTSKWNDGRLRKFDMKEAFKNWEQWLKLTAEAIRKDWPEIITLETDQILQIAESTAVFDSITADSNSFYPVLTHGDMWSNNILFLIDKNSGEITDDVAAVIDWQAVRKGNPADDLSRVLVLCVDHNIRKEHEMELLKEYYASLKQHLPKDFEIPFTFEEVHIQYKRLFRYASTCLLMFVGAFLQNNPNMKNASESKKEQFVRRAQIALADALEYSQNGQS